MHNNCKHNLFICHCTPSNLDPVPIHPPLPPKPVNLTSKFLSDQNNTLPQSSGSSGNPASLYFSIPSGGVLKSQRIPAGGGRSSLKLPNYGRQFKTLPRKMALSKSADGQNNSIINAFSNPSSTSAFLADGTFALMAQPAAANTYPTFQTSPKLRLKLGPGSVSFSTASPSTNSSAPSISPPSSSSSQVVTTLPVRTRVNETGLVVKASHQNRSLCPVDRQQEPCYRQRHCVAESPADSSVAFMALSSLTTNTLPRAKNPAGIADRKNRLSIPYGNLVPPPQQQLQLQLLSSGSSSSASPRHVRRKYEGCSIWTGRSCLERVIFGLLVSLLSTVFLIGSVVFVQVLSGAPSGGLKAISAMVFSGSDDDVGAPQKGSLPAYNGDPLGATGTNPDDDLGRLLSDDDIDLVRIKTTEEVSRWPSLWLHMRRCG